MIYLVGSTILDISYSVHQRARFSHNHKRRHEATYTFDHYLRGNKSKGIIMISEQDNLILYPFSNVDFARFVGESSTMSTFQFEYFFNGLSFSD